MTQRRASREAARSPDDAVDVVNAFANPARSPSRLWAAALVFAGWLTALVVLVVTTANPVTLNRRQVLQSRVIVEAEVADASRETCSVQRSWPVGLGVGTDIRIEGLTSLHLQPETRYLIPLNTTDAGTYRVTPVHDGSDDLRVYPASADAVTQLEQILTQEAARDER
jgi:hypothetical protein